MTRTQVPPRHHALVTTSRMPFALDMIRKLGKQGHAVHATDTFRTAPGQHSSYLEGQHLTASPRYEPARFVDDLLRIIDEQRIDVLLPSFEDAFYIVGAAARFEGEVEVFAPSFELMLQLHDKDRMRRLAEELGVAVPDTVVAKSEEELRRASEHFGAFFARPVYSRGGVELLTNTGPLAGALALEACHPTETNPWLVQPFVTGQDVCTCSIARHGRMVAHGAYVHPREIEHDGGIVFESVDAPDTLAIAKTIVEATGYHGHISLDFLRTGDGLVLIECNPRPTAGLFAMSPEMYDRALLGPPTGDVAVAEAGVRKKYSSALIRDMFLHFREAPEDIKHLFSAAKEHYAEPGDLLPGIYQLLSYSHVIAYRLKVGRHSSNALLQAYFDDVLFNG